MRRCFRFFSGGTGGPIFPERSGNRLFPPVATVAKVLRMIASTSACRRYSAWAQYPGTQLHAPHAA